MTMLGTIVSPGSGRYEVAAWDRLYPTKFPAKSLGCNRKSSIERWRGTRAPDVSIADTPKVPGVRWSINKPRRIMQLEQGENSRYFIKFSQLALSFDRNQIEGSGIGAGDMVPTLVEIQPGLLPHVHAWADTEELPYEYRENANSLAIQLFGMVKNPHDTVDIGEKFVI